MTTKRYQASVLCTCNQCGVSFKRQASQIANKKTPNFFCSHDCHSQYQKATGLVTIQCKQCSKDFKAPKSDRRSYCSLDCSRASRRTAKANRCQDCGVEISKYSPRCKSCACAHANSKFPDRKIEDLVYDNQGAFNAYTRIRSRARTVARRAGWNSCRKCGYDKHIEVCHLKPIKDFPKDTLESVVNSLENLVPLCPNCHWEYDKGLLSLE